MTDVFQFHSSDSHDQTTTQCFNHNSLSTYSCNQPVEQSDYEDSIPLLPSPMPPLSKFGRRSLSSDYSTKRAKVYQSFLRCGTCSDLATDMQSSMQVTFQRSTSHKQCDDIAIPSPNLSEQMNDKLPSALLSALKVRIYAFSDMHLPAKVDDIHSPTKTCADEKVYFQIHISQLKLMICSFQPKYVLTRRKRDS